jgi:choline dehydrogenase-like flavoprotein
MERTAERFDYAVLGGGTAGCVVAARLREDAGRSVCLVEAGPDYGPHSAGGWPADMLSTFSLPDSHDWSDGEATLRIARVLGGCSAHNACFLVRGAPADYDGWGPGWSHAELAPYLDRATEAIGGRPLADEEETPWGNVVRGAAAELGIPIVDAEGDGAVEGLARFPINVAGGARWNAAFAHLDPARGRDNLELVADSTVDRLELDGSSPPKAVVARFDGGELRIRAERFVIAAGAYGSPAILLRSGVGPPDHLRELSIPVRHELPVGDGLQDHAGMAILFEPGDELRRETLEYARRPGGGASGARPPQGPPRRRMPVQAAKPPRRGGTVGRALDAVLRLAARRHRHPHRRAIRQPVLLRDEPALHRCGSAALARPRRAAGGRQPVLHRPGRTRP